MGSISKFLLAKDMNAALVAFVCIMLSFVGIPGEILASIIIAFITMKKGYQSGAVVLAFVALPAVAFLLHKQISPFDFMFLQCVVVWLLAILFRQYHSWSLNFEVMAVVGVVVLFVFHLFVPDTAQFWMNIILELVKNLNVDVNANINVDDMASVLQPFSHYLTGLLLFVVSSMLFLELLVARRWDLRTQQQPALFNQEFINIHIGYVAAGLLCLTVVGVLCDVNIARDGLFILLLPFMFGGLSYIHYIAKKHHSMIFLLIVLYISLFISFTSIITVLLLALIGFLDSLCNFRKRFAF